MGRTVRVAPKAVVVSGGALNSPALLLRSGIAQGPVGKKTWLHPVVAVGAFYKDRVEGFYGAPQSVASHHFAHRSEGAGFFMEAAPVHPMLASIAMPGFGAALRARMALLAHVSATISLMIDGFDPAENGGAVTLPPHGGAQLEYPFSDRLYQIFRARMKAVVPPHLANRADQKPHLHNTPPRLPRQRHLP